MANTVTRGGQFLTLSAIDTDFVWSDLWATIPPILSIQFVPAAATDKLVLREGSLTGPVFMSEDLPTAFEPTCQKVFMGHPIKVCMDVSDGSYNAGAMVIIHIGTK